MFSIAEEAAGGHRGSSRPDAWRGPALEATPWHPAPGTQNLVEIPHMFLLLFELDDALGEFAEFGDEIHQAVGVEIARVAVRRHRAFRDGYWLPFSGQLKSVGHCDSARWIRW